MPKFLIDDETLKSSSSSDLENMLVDLDDVTDDIRKEISRRNSDIDDVVEKLFQVVKQRGFDSSHFYRKFEKDLTVTVSGKLKMEFDATVIFRGYDCGQSWKPINVIRSYDYVFDEESEFLNSLILGGSEYNEILEKFPEFQNIANTVLRNAMTIKELLAEMAPEITNDYSKNKIIAKVIDRIVNEEDFDE